jgi:hypothetical protein
MVALIRAPYHQAPRSFPVILRASGGALRSATETPGRGVEKFCPH